MNRFSRVATSMLLALSLLTSSFVAMAQTSQANEPQDKDKATTEQQKPAQSHKPLSVNEDPNMIGKRNINKGLGAKLAGSTEKEVRLGRQLAAEVDRQARFVEDPMITEYVN